MDVRRATEADRERIVAVLAAAFSHDPPLRFLVPERRREARLRTFFAAALPHYDAWVCVEPFGAALWAPPGAYPFSLAQQARQLPAQVRTFGRNLRRAAAADRTLAEHHPHEPHWYLDFVAVDPAAHGRGAGSALLRAVLERADADGSPAFLNAGSPRSRDLYARHGFAARGEVRLPHGGPPVWPMWREPYASTSSPVSAS